MKKVMILTVMGLALLAAAGCTVVSSEKMVGDKPAVLEKANWEGRWLAGGEWVTVRVLDAEKGLLELKVPTEEQPIKLALWSVADSDFFIFNMPLGDTPDGKQADTGPYAWGAVRGLSLDKMGEQMIVWLPNTERFRDLVEAGKLEGVLEGNDVNLKSVSTEQLKMMLAVESGCFEWTEPIALVREKPAMEPTAVTQPPAEETVARIDSETLEVLHLPQSAWEKLGQQNGKYKSPNTGRYSITGIMKCAACGDSIPQPDFPEPTGDAEADAAAVEKVKAEYRCMKCAKNPFGK